MLYTILQAILSYWISKGGGCLCEWLPVTEAKSHTPFNIHEAELAPNEYSKHYPLKKKCYDYVSCLTAAWIDVPKLARSGRCNI